jgi:cob(I)alamin adenosyltransferase
MAEIKEEGFVHLYYGNGKGKTTTGMGLCVRAAGYGYKVLIYQFMKDNTTSERNALALIPQITVMDGLPQEKFSFQMTQEEKDARRSYYESQFALLTEKACKEDYDVLFCDELVYAIRAGLFTEAKLLEFLANRPKKLEVILTGRDPSPALLEACDYASEICKIKHPFDQGLPARKGIEK